MENLQKRIEAVRKQLDKAVAEGTFDTTVYELSVELDKLIAAYYELKEQKKA